MVGTVTFPAEAGLLHGGDRLTDGSGNQPGKQSTAPGRTASDAGQLPLAVAVFGPDAALIAHTLNFASLLCLPAKAICRGMSLAAMIAIARRQAEYAAPEAQTFLAAQLALDRSRPSSVRRVREDRSIVEVASTPCSDGGWFIAASKIGTLARAEDAVGGRAAMLTGILDAIPHGVCVYDPDKRVVLFNRSYSVIMAGAPIGIGDHLGEIVQRRAEAGEYGPGAPEGVAAEHLAYDVDQPQVRRRRRPNGTMIDIRTAPLQGGGHLSVVSDITSLMEAEDEVTRRAEELDLMLANIQHGIILWDRHARAVASNRVAAELLELSPDMVVRGRTRGELLAETVVDGADAHAALPTPGSPGAERRLTRSGRILEWRAEPGPNGGSVSTLTDVTDVRAAAHELHRAKAAAEAANQAKSRFLATMSHELRTPLNAVIGFSDALGRGGGQDDPDRVAEFARAINEAGRQLLTLVNNILDVARIDAGRFELSSEWIDLARLIGVCARQIDPAAQAAEVSLQADVPPDLPPLQADERRLRQVLTQLLSNAVKFTPAGGAVTVSAACEATGELLVVVADSGIGIAEADLQQAFEPFGQVDSSLSRPFQGSGLGLYIARALIQAHDGQLLLRSALGQGTTVEIRLPAARLGAREQGARASRQERS